MGYNKHGRSRAFTLRLPIRCVEIIDELIEAGVYSSRGECIRDIIRSAFREGFHKKMLAQSKRFGVDSDNSKNRRKTRST